MRGGLGFPLRDREGKRRSVFIKKSLPPCVRHMVCVAKVSLYEVFSKHDNPILKILKKSYKTKIMSAFKFKISARALKNSLRLELTECLPG